MGLLPECLFEELPPLPSISKVWDHRFYSLFALIPAILFVPSYGILSLVGFYLVYDLLSHLSLPPLSKLEWLRLLVSRHFLPHCAYSLVAMLPSLYVGVVAIRADFMYCCMVLFAALLITAPLFLPPLFSAWLPLDLPVSTKSSSVVPLATDGGGLSDTSEDSDDCSDCSAASEPGQPGGTLKIPSNDPIEHEDQVPSRQIVLLVGYFLGFVAIKFVVRGRV